MRAPPGARLREGKFVDPDRTVSGEERARVRLAQLETLWFNTGTLCNLNCKRCYLESGPRNNRLAYLTAQEVDAYLQEIEELDLETSVIGFTGGEPFMNPEFPAMMANALDRGLDVLVLTNGTRPMQRPRTQRALKRLEPRGAISIRVSLDHSTARYHDDERGPGAFQRATQGIDWLVAHGFRTSVAGRLCWNEPEATARDGYDLLFAARGWPIDAYDPRQLVLFPELDATADVPEISTSCWDALRVAPSSVMCASSRMVVRRRDAPSPVVMPCTLIAYEREFEMGGTLAESFRADGGCFSAGSVKLKHPHCARFCVLGGASCSEVR